MTTPSDRPREAGTRELDIVVYGATGFVGRLVAGHLADHAPEDIRIGLAGRSVERLEKTRSGLGDAAASWPILHADSGEPESLAALAAATGVVVSTVGPYARWGMPLVQACAQAGTDYVDLTGEVLFVRSSIDSWHETAASNGARIVHSCGFDSIPSDLGVLMLDDRVRSDGEGELADTTLVVTSLRGGVSGGTIDSLRLQLDTVKRDKALRRVAAGPYSLSPDRSAEPDLGAQSDVRIVEGSKIDPSVRGWKAPFVMGSFNTRVVRRSNALLDWRYGRTFRYSEVMSVGSSPLSILTAAAVAAGLGGLVAGLSFGPTRALLDRVLPSPGEGPSEKARKSGHFTIDVFTETTTGARYRARVAAQGDPGYAATAVMLGESALTLAVNRDRLPGMVGVLTPATAMGDALVDRLREAGFTLTVDRL